MGIPPLAERPRLTDSWGLGKLEESAIALLEKHPDHSTVEGIVSNIINGAKANASESELEEIQRLEDQAFEF
ncbi:hypothetical protein FRE64_17300 (plasmid) [Euhalothece natronophila Z-M001]|uniref:Uncharacterized protein n=1 Tax=Euhalothece natronophila Z-M001 TaxID=522448 RepID=A0A5B8NRY8_9CHRO|nr:hypothetical protein [Euhalothece natronophila]QDZ41702.1 hypothetical protein FRE64_17220 [Euhalothece natronophila Z-M001]QDZ41717.1 hypothetical protein FRE64_17300 [Euhalothece natronophila Z-M001]